MISDNAITIFSLINLLRDISEQGKYQHRLAVRNYEQDFIILSSVLNKMSD